MGPHNMVFPESLNEFVNVCAHGFDAHTVGTASFLRDVCFIVPLFEEAQDCGSHSIETENPIVQGIEYDSAVFTLRVPNSLGDSKHRLAQTRRLRARISTIV